jgi:hypothetical protein
MVAREVRLHLNEDRLVRGVGQGMFARCRAWLDDWGLLVLLTFTFALEYMSFGALDTMLSNELLLFREAGFAGRERFLQDWRWIRGDWVHSMEFLTEAVGLVSEEDLCSFDLSKPEGLSNDFRRRYGLRIQVWLENFTELRLAV